MLYNFQGGRDGCFPYSVTVGPGGVLYGATYGSNSFTSGAGTVFQLTPPATPGGSWTKTTLVEFGQRPGHGPNADSPLILRHGNPYGTIHTAPGGAVFELQPPATPGGTWTTTYLHDFTNGQIPGGAFVIGGQGTIYGVTAAPLFQPAGTIYRIAAK